MKSSFFTTLALTATLAGFSVTAHAVSKSQAQANLALAAQLNDAQLNLYITQSTAKGDAYLYGDAFQGWLSVQINNHQSQAPDNQTDAAAICTCVVEVDPSTIQSWQLPDIGDHASTHRHHRHQDDDLFGNGDSSDGDSDSDDDSGSGHHHHHGSGDGGGSLGLDAWFANNSFSAMFNGGNGGNGGNGMGGGNQFQNPFLMNSGFGGGQNGMGGMNGGQGSPFMMPYMNGMNGGQNSPFMMPYQQGGNGMGGMGGNNFLAGLSPVGNGFGGGMGGGLGGGMGGGMGGGLGGGYGLGGGQSNPYMLPYQQGGNGMGGGMGGGIGGGFGGGIGGGFGNAPAIAPYQYNVGASYNTQNPPVIAPYLI